MKQLTRAQYFFLGSMLFGMMFGAGNLIFPVHLGQLAGSHFWFANWGFISTGVFMPFIGLIALGISGATSVEDLANRVHPTFSKIFTVLLYLTIGPCFALPRTASVSFQIGVAPFVPPGSETLTMALFTGVFMALALLMGLKPSKLIVYIGKFLNPAFLLFLALLVSVAFIHPMGSYSAMMPHGAYVSQPYLTGFKEGYNTMDVLAILAFAIVVINTLQSLGLTDRSAMTGDIFKVGVIVTVLMTVIYTAITWLGVSSMGALTLSDNGPCGNCSLLLWTLGTAAPGRHRNPRLLQDGDWAHYELLRSVPYPFPQRTGLPDLLLYHGRIFLCCGERGPYPDHQSGHSRPHVHLSPSHCPYPVDLYGVFLSP